ncbi:transmembrane protein, putative [Medicago truncatula]|uniref:Transmembrane protein, putative n=1 Tax=Medicago truncatula TaxID=3880 RepID=G7LC22_MEDTR|nr:transmembrane protein, putative [Medicago truncatula]
MRYKVVIYYLSVQPMKNTKATKPPFSFVILSYLNFSPFPFVTYLLLAHTKNNIDYFVMTFHKRI